MKRSLLGLVAVAIMVAAPQAHAARKAIWGPNRTPTGESAFEIYRELRVDVFQTQLVWGRIAATRPKNPADPRDAAYKWPAALDETVSLARAKNIGVALLVRGSPSWANGGRSLEYAPRRVKDYVDFITAASRRYPSVRHWMIWGETNRAVVFRPLPKNRPTGPRRYARLLDAAYVALKKRSRRNRVIGGMTFTNGEVKPADYVRWMRLPSGRPPRLDYYGHNPFTFRFPRLNAPPLPDGARDMSDLDTFRAELRKAYRRDPRHRRRGPRMWLAEFTISSDRPNRAFGFAVSREEQARWVRAAFRIADRARYVEAIGWFGLYDEPAGTPHGLTTGLMTYEGVRKPAFFAYRDARSR